MVESLLLVPKAVGSNLGRPTFLSSYCKLFFLLAASLTYSQSYISYLIIFFEISKNDKNKDFLPTVTLKTWVRVRAAASNSDSMNDFILIVFFGFTLKII